MTCASSLDKSIVLIGLLAVSSISSTSVAEEQAKEMATKLAEVCRKHDVPAMAAAVVNANGLVKSAKQIEPPFLWGHTQSGEPVDPRTAGAENPTVYAAVGTVHLSIEDYAKYARWHLAGKAAPVLQSKSAYDHLHKPQVDYTALGAKYACGWICVDTGLCPALNHGGSNTNSFALIWVVPARLLRCKT